MALYIGFSGAAGGGGGGGATLRGGAGGGFDALGAFGVALGVLATTGALTAAGADCPGNGRAAGFGLELDVCSRE